MQALFLLLENKCCKGGLLFTESCYDGSRQTLLDSQYPDLPGERAVQELQVIDPCPSRTAVERERQVQRPYQVGYDTIAPVGSNSYANQTHKTGQSNDCYI